MADYLTTDTELTSIADAIRTKGGTSAALEYPDEFVSAIEAIPTHSEPVLQTKSRSYTPTESAQSESVTADAGYDGLDKVNISVGAIASDYVGSGVARRSSSDLSASGATVTAPAGYYASSASKSVSSGTAGTPTASKGSVSNHSVSVTPSVTNSAGYISGGTKTGTAVTVSASELVSGSETKTANGTYDVTNLAQIVVNVAAPVTMNCQGYMGVDSVNKTSLTATNVELTVAKTGTYSVSWFGHRTYTSGSSSRLYVNGSSRGSEQTAFSPTTLQSVTLTGISLNAGDVVCVYAKASASSYRMYVGNLIIQQTA